PYESSNVWLTLAYGSARRLRLFSCLPCSTPFLPIMDSTVTSTSSNFNHSILLLIVRITRLDHLHPIMCGERFAARCLWQPLVGVACTRITIKHSSALVPALFCPFEPTTHAANRTLSPIN
ncbi:hypothetical protein IFM46972_02670, partial [Aspergillus udagawae]